MFHFLKSFTGFGPKCQSNEDMEDMNGSNRLESDVLSREDSPSSDSEDDDFIESLIDNRILQRVKQIETKEKAKEEDYGITCGDDWDVFEEEVNGAHKQLLTTDSKNKSVNGVVTRVVDDSHVLIDDIHSIKYDRCAFGQPLVGDLVSIEVKEREVWVKPLRYKILTGKITDYEKRMSRFIFSRHAILRESDETADMRLKTGDVVKVIVIEIRTNAYSWRAILFDQYRDPELIQMDESQLFTEALLENKNEIEIMDKIELKDLQLNSRITSVIWIRNRGKKAQTLLSCNCEEGEHQIMFRCFQSSYGKPSEPPFVIPALKSCYVEITCEAKYCGDHSELLVFQFDGFRIGRYISFTVLDFTDKNSRKGHKSSRSEAAQHRQRLFGEDTWIVRGEKVWNSNKHIYDKLERYRIPEDMWRALENNWALDGEFPQLTQPLTKANYQKKFHALVYLEECENQLNLKKFDMKNASLRRDGKFLALLVPGLADGRPSLIISDKIIVFDDNNSCEEKKKRLAFEGYIHEIRKDEILVRFNEDFHRDFNGGSFKVMFQMGRTIYRRCHHAIDLSPHMVEQVLFPEKVIIKPPFKKVPLDSIKWFNEALNIEQKLAVVGALRGECRPTPYIIFGPPGTGKTVTIVESILQVLEKVPSSRIIACTAANSSADLIATKLLESGKVTDKELIRISALHRLNNIPENLKDVTSVADEDEKKWLYHRILVTTSSQAGIVFRHKISPSHYTHVFIDEAAQVTEPESLIPISMSVISHGVVVLAGDHQQLGPVVMSSFAKTNGLDRSLMERLMTECQPYQRDESFIRFGKYNPKFVTKLVHNYRSDQKIMAIPSQLFYKNELIFETKTDDKLLTDMNFKYPLVFSGVKGEDRQDDDCPSWYNPQEIIQTCSHLDKLYEAGVKPEEIGIITPYRKQVSRIRTHIQDMGLDECKVATIEEFQGLEKRVIIVSMVRSSQQWIKFDTKFNLGFIHNSKRFNVAVSRAMALLICVGDPYILSRSGNWSQLIELCLKNGSYSGCSYKNYSPKTTKRQIAKSIRRESDSLVSNGF